MREIEVKAKAADLKALEQHLKSLGCILSEPLKQDDIIFVDKNYGEFAAGHPEGKCVLRIRNSNGKILFTLKQSQKNELDAIECETEIKDADAMREALELMGYFEVVQVHKIRRKTLYQGLEICLDEVQDLGAFIEVEKLAQEADSEAVQKELFEFLKTLGIKSEDQVFRGYDTLTYLKLHPQNS